ncbi:MAG: shikimate kinase [Pyrinomonadaceae bacterium]|jgi:shikimate kinase|nr:shikimate kinase [Pyrinomonadaceae bacterium]
MLKLQQIVIIGFMGTGKTTVAEALGRRLDRRSLDLDDMITARQKRTPRQIIEADGEPAFRRIETGMLRGALKEQCAAVLALGGGAWTIAENRDLITERGAIAVWLDAPFELCWERIAAGGQTRPLARSRAEAEKLYAARQPLYRLAAVRIPVHESDSVADLVVKIARALVAPDKPTLD